MSEITLEKLDERIAETEKRLSRYKSEPRHGEFQSYALLEEQASEELEILKLALQALSQGDVVWEGMMHCLVDQDVAMINDIPAHQLFECNTGDFDRIAHETGLKGQDVHVTIRRAQ